MWQTRRHIVSDTLLECTVTRPATGPVAALNRQLVQSLTRPHRHFTDQRGRHEGMN
jgi:hypothetical protein